jgi:Domain of unknown function (DUF4124)
VILTIFSYNSLIIIISILFFPFHSIAQIYKWVDEKGTVHFSDDPPKIEEEYVPESEKPRQDTPKSSFGEVAKSIEDLRNRSGQRSNGMFKAKGVSEVKEEKSMIGWIYPIGLFIILLIIIKIMKEPKPVAIRGEMSLRGSFVPPERTVLFNVYYRDYSVDSMVFLGRIVERRKRERGNNFGDLSSKARQDYQVKDPSAIFLLRS